MSFMSLRAILAGSEGIEPSLSVLEALVLPLDEQPIIWSDVGLLP
jgi:hypothetical protein